MIGIIAISNASILNVVFLQCVAVPGNRGDVMGKFALRKLPTSNLF